MNMWEILGIPPTTDIVAIKKAYADRAKQWHPEEHPEEFKRLRNAYQTAVKLAKNGVAADMGAGMKQPEKRAEEPQPEKQSQSETQPKPTEQEEGQGPHRAEWEEEPQPQFSYEDVSSFYQKELSECFFKEFSQIAWNPYLQNRKAVWKYFLFQPDYDDLYCHEEFRQRLLQEICAVPGWSGETLDYFEWWQELCWESGWKGKKDNIQMDSAARQWSRKKWRSRFTLFMPEYVVSKEQRQEHYGILQILKDRGPDGSLMSTASAEAYLKYYRAFLKDNEGWPETQRRFSYKKRLKYWMMSGAVMFFLMIILIMVLVVRPALKRTGEEETGKQREREEVILQESLEQEEWQQELEDRFGNMQEQYRDWIEQQD